MSKQIKFLIFLPFLVIFLFVLPNFNYVNAVTYCSGGGTVCSGCTQWSTQTYCCTFDQYSNCTGSCTRYVCVAPATQTCTGTCDPGCYQCNGGTSCCQISGATPTPDPGPTPTPCYVTTSPATYNLYATQTSPITASVTSGLGAATVTNMFFGSYNTAIATVNPTSDNTSVYTTTVTAVAAGSTAVWATATLSDGRICQQASGAADTDVVVTAAPSCSISLSPGTTNLTLGGADGTITATASCSVAITNVTFDSSNPSFVSITSTAADTSVPYTATVHGVATGASQITGTIYVGGVPFLASSPVVVNVTPLEAWFQVKDADVNSGGDLTTQVIAPNVFNTPGSGTFPGIPVYSGTTDLTNLRTSTLGWLVKNTATNQKTNYYQSLVSQIPATTTINTIATNSIAGSALNSGGTIDAATGYYWYQYDGTSTGDLTLTSAADVGARKVILLVNSANFNINAPINVTDGSGFFMVLVGKTSSGTKGNIVVGSAVGGAVPQAAPNLEGIYEADGTFSDSVAATQLWLRGSLAAHGGASLLRDLVAGNASTPAELFEFAPDQLILYPSKLGTRRLNWKEVAP